MTMSYPLSLIIGYLIGSIPFAYLNSKLRGGNIFAQGSGNPGATNTWTLYGKRAALLVLALDVLKGFIPTFTVAQVTGDLHLAFWTGAGCVLGHAFSLYTKFQGGKALASALGVLGYLYPVGLAVVVISYVLSALIMRYIVVATTFVIVGAAVYFLWTEPDLSKQLAFMTMVIPVLYRHLPNWERIYLRNEPKITERVHEITLERLSKPQQIKLRVAYFAVSALVVLALVFLARTA
ncbi:MAG: glycerol-3-phosphate 1-O-acyltransferase PlsY [Tumebacillaceae bacterium]